MEEDIRRSSADSCSPLRPPSGPSHRGYPPVSLLRSIALAACSLAVEPPPIPRGPRSRFRAVFARMLRDYTMRSLWEIVEVVGARSHTTVADLLATTAESGRGPYASEVADATMRLDAMGWRPRAGRDSACCAPAGKPLQARAPHRA